MERETDIEGTELSVRLEIRRRSEAQLCPDLPHGRQLLQNKMWRASPEKKSMRENSLNFHIFWERAKLMFVGM